MKKYLPSITMIVLALMTAFAVSAEIPSGYYTSLNGKKDVALKTAARDIIYKHTQVSSYSDLPQYFRKTDKRPGTNLWWEMYSNQTFYLSSFEGLNREHAVPKSWWGGSSSTPAYTDLNHLYPSEMKANSAKSNYPLGTVQSSTFDNGVSKVGSAPTGQGGGAQNVFEPADEYKGDFARTYFYMATCYAGYLTWKYNYMFQDTDLTLNQWSQMLLLKWHRQDPVSQKEIDRNEAVYGIQNNRNPFIDFPELAEYIWGNKKGQTFSTALPDTPTGDANLITPTQDMVVDFGQVAIGNGVTQKLLFKGENMTGSITLTLSSKSENPEMFNLADESIKASLVNAEGGYWLNITYKPTSIGNHSARLIISDGGIIGSRGIALVGSCLEEPKLSTLVAMEPSNITDNSYTANWEAATEEIDYYIVTRIRYVDGTASVDEIEADDNSLEITDFDPSIPETYSVQSVRLGYRSPMSNVITVEHSGISGVEVDVPLGTAYCPGGIRFICGEEHTGGRIYDTMGRLVYTIDVITNNMEVMLPWGVYYIVTDQLSTPLGILVR